MIKKRARGNLSPNSGAKARRKGHNFERLIRKRLLPIYPKCQTSRYASKMLDDNGIDFVGTYPFVIQAKNVERGVNPQKILSEMIINYMMKSYQYKVDDHIKDSFTESLDKN